jgi:hypothetical protein
MGTRLYVTATEAVIQHVAGVSPELASQVRLLDGIYQAARLQARSQGRWLGEQDQDPRYLAYSAYGDAMRPLGPTADLYASLAFGDGFNSFQGYRLVSNADFGSETDPLSVAQILEAQQRWARDCGDDVYGEAFVAALKRAEQIALRGDLTVSWG